MSAKHPKSNWCFSIDFSTLEKTISSQTCSEKYSLERTLYVCAYYLKKKQQCFSTCEHHMTWSSFQTLHKGRFYPLSKINIHRFVCTPWHLKTWSMLILHSKIGIYLTVFSVPICNLYAVQFFSKFKTVFQFML